MALTFNHATTRIVVGSPQTAIVVQDLLNAIREEEASDRGIAYGSICTAVGKNSLGGAVATGITLTLLSSWLLEFYTGDYVATVDGGNLVAASGNPMAAVVGGPQIEITRSAAATVVSTSGGPLTTAEHDQLMSLAIATENAAAVRTELASGSPIPVNVKKVNDVTLVGDGVGTPMGAA